MPESAAKSDELDITTNLSTSFLPPIVGSIVLVSLIASVGLVR
jgi:hypothetical protein